ncbi:MAG: hypothetical protein K2H01_07980 [Ruminococcus sp.]|nr:hypothetical protein [Ruminococcus sp.]
MNIDTKVLVSILEQVKLNDAQSEELQKVIYRFNDGRLVESTAVEHIKKNETQVISNTNVTEWCPHCDTEITMEWNIKERGYEAHCPVCGEILMLCSECDCNCNWSDESKSCKNSKID